MSTTRWSDTKTNLLDDAISLLIDAVTSDEKQTSISWENWHFTKAFDRNPSIQLNGRDIQYNMIKCAYDQISPGDRQ